MWKNHQIKRLDFDLGNLRIKGKESEKSEDHGSEGDCFRPQKNERMETEQGPLEEQNHDFQVPS